VPSPVDTTQAAILEAAFEAVIKYGYDGATTRRIAQIADVNEVTLFRKFGTKAKLLAEVIRREAEAFRTQAVTYSGDIEADLVAVVSAHRDLIKRRGRMIPVLLAELPRRPELMGLTEGPRMAFQAIAALLCRYQAEGRLGPENPVTAIAALLAPVGLPTLAATLFGLDLSLDPRTHVRRYLDGRRPSKEVADAGR
jgi:AcrR family transcriptional regulator